MSAAALGAVAGGIAGGLVAVPRLAGAVGRARGGPAIARGVTTVQPEAMVAHVRNVTTGEVALLVGTREIIYRDPALVARLVGAARQSG
ncbi:MAG TPA: hypothetical protein VHJ99_04485 [Candidatus Dormibacteraeota bacterium]|nr:hypothetical protein [Candidatus Dormibacteraeota bacterium]